MNPEQKKELIERSLAEYVERRELGDSLTPEQFAGKFPGLEKEILAAVLELENTEGLFPQKETQVPREIGPYRVLGELGHGGMGRVLKVEHRDRPGKPLALKLLSLVSQFNPRAQERFQREGELLQRIQHPGIVRVLESGVAEGNSYLVMELIEGTSLAERNLAASESYQEAARIIARLARAVACLHDNGLIHRDIKPSNVLVPETGDPVLVDFGLAGAEDTPTLTQSGDLLGTPQYMSPEQARGERTGPAADIYALGAILYELLAGQPPHTGADPMQILERVKTKPVRPLRQIKRKIPRPLAIIAGKALAYSPQARFGSATELAEDLEAYLAGQRIRSRLDRMEAWKSLWRYRRIPMVGVTGVLLGTLLVSVIYLTAGTSSSEEIIRRSLDRASMAYAAGDLAGTEDGARQILAQDPSHPIGEFLLTLSKGSLLMDSADPLVDAMIRGEAARREGKFQPAIANFRRAMELAPDSPLPVVLLGKTYKEEGNFQERVKGIEEALKLQPKSAALHRSLGLVYLNQGSFREAQEKLGEAVRLDPEVPGLYVDLARARFRTEGVQATLKSAREGAMKIPKEADKILVAVASFLNREKNGAAARELLQPLLEEKGETKLVTFEMGVSYDIEERMLEALEWYKKSEKIDPGFYRPPMHMANIYAGAQRSTCEKCKEFYAKHPEIFDPEKAVQNALKFLDSRQGGRLNSLLYAVSIANKVKRTGEVRERLEDLAAGETDPEILAHLKTALQKLE